jgi:hypothetical protein
LVIGGILMDRTTLFKGIDPDTVKKILAACKLPDQTDYSEAQSQQVLKEIERLNASAQAKKPEPAAKETTPAPKTAAPPAQSDPKPQQAKETAAKAASLDGTVTDQALEVRDTAISHLSQVVDEQMEVLATQDAPDVREMMMDAYMRNLAQAMQKLPPLAQADVIDVKVVKLQLLERQQQRRLAMGGQAEPRQLPAAQPQGSTKS